MVWLIYIHDRFYEWQRDKPKDKKPFYIYPRNEITEDSKENVIVNYNTPHI